MLEQSHPLLRFYQEPIHLQLKLQNQVVPIEIYPIKRKMLFYIIYSSGTPWPHYGQSMWLILKSQLITYFLQLQLEYSRKFEEYQQRNELFLSCLRMKRGTKLFSNNFNNIIAWQ